ncbi:MAG: tetratricopeptide repeat protein [Bacteroidales bacterium]
MHSRKWLAPFILVSILVFTISLRQLSDPDLGFHLKYGKWIVTNLQVPTTDQSTYTVTDHAYTDLHWLFQVIIYGVYKVAGYTGISLFVCLLSVMLFLLVLLRLRNGKVPLSLTSIALLTTFLVIEPRITPRPEMFTFIFLTFTLFILDRYTGQRKNLLYLLPITMLLWSNMHALFILGLLTISIYFAGITVRTRKIDRKLLIVTLLSWLMCLINPYGINGFSLPLELLTRFDPNNIYNQHIQEFIPFFLQTRFVLRDFLFIMLLLLGSLVIIPLIRKRNLHEVLLLLIFGFLAITSIRNIPLFVIVAVPILGREALGLTLMTRPKKRAAGIILFVSLIIITLALIPRLITNAYYRENNSFNRTGTGLDPLHQPAGAASFLLHNHLGGRMLNSIGFGGWLSWTLPQPVFMDGRLEVMQESIYMEVTRSWSNGLPDLISKYKPELIIYNYLKYYPWTMQLAGMPDWKLIYIDGIAAVFAKTGYASQLPEIDLKSLPQPETGQPKELNTSWMKGFYQPDDGAETTLRHLASFRFQMNSTGREAASAEKAIVYFNRANIRYRNSDINGALADYDSAILIQPDYAKAYNNRGVLRAWALKDFTGAISDFTKAIEYSPEYGDAYLGRGTAYFYARDLQSACADWQRARSLGNLQATTLIELHCARQ